MSLAGWCLGSGIFIKEMYSKTTFLSLLTVFAVAICGYSFTLLDTNNIWSIMVGPSYGCPDLYCSSYFLKIGGDTTLGQVNYKKVLRSNDSLYRNWSKVCLIREDSTGKVYLLGGPQTPTSYPECLLYDFGLSVGDTIRPNCNGCIEDCFMVVDSVQNEIVNGTSRKVISFAQIGEKWIEGIGSNRGLLNSAWFIVGGTERLLCFKEGDTVKYHADGYDVCFLQVDNEAALSHGNNPKPKLRFMPNPFTDKAQLMMEGFTGILDIGIYDIRGVRVLHLSGVKDKKVELDIGILQSGVYFIKVFDDQHKMVVKTIDLLK